MVKAGSIPAVRVLTLSTNEMKESFIVHTAFYEPIKGLSDKQLGKLFRELFHYSLGESNVGIDQVDDDIRMAFLFFKNQMDIDNRKYHERCTINKANAARGGALNGNSNLRKKTSGGLDDNRNNPEVAKTTERLKNKRTQANACETSDCKRTQANAAYNDNDNDNVNENENERGGASAPQPPTSEDFSGLTQELRESLETYFAMRAQSGFPIFDIQQSTMVKALLSAVSGDVDRAVRWVKNATQKNLRDFYAPFDENKQPNNEIGLRRGSNKTYSIDDEIMRKNQREFESLRASGKLDEV